VTRGVERGALLPFLGARARRFLRVQPIGAKPRFGRRMEIGGLGGASMRHDGSVAGGFFLVGMDDPLACEDRRQKQTDRRRQWPKLLMRKRKKFQNSCDLPELARGDRLPELTNRRWVAPRWAAESVERSGPVSSGSDRPGLFLGYSEITHFVLCPSSPDFP